MNLKLSLTLLPLAFQTLFADVRIEVSSAGFETPESIEYYQQKDLYLVTNIHGNPLEKDGNGFISKVRPDGTILDLKWIDGTKDDVDLDAPKGAEVVGNFLYVTDLQNLRIFELPSGKPHKTIHMEDSTFLNGITKADEDSVYVTDSGLKEGFAPSGTDTVYQVYRDGKVKTILKDPEMGRPNGIIHSNNELYIVTFGSGELFKIDAQYTKQALPKPSKAGLDGFVQLHDGSFLISSWGESAIYSYHHNKYEVLFKDLDAPADMGLDTKRNRLLVPLFKENKLVFLSLN